MILELYLAVAVLVNGNFVPGIYPDRIACERDLAQAKEMPQVLAVSGCEKAKVDMPGEEPVAVPSPDPGNAGS